MKTESFFLLVMKKKSTSAHRNIDVKKILQETKLNMKEKDCF